MAKKFEASLPASALQELGKMSDQEWADRWGCSITTAHTTRKRHNVKALYSHRVSKSERPVAVSIRVTEKEEKVWKAAARAEGLTLSEWMAQKLNQAAK